MVITDIYRGRAVDVWSDGELAFIAINPNGLTFFIPIEHLAELFSEFAKAQASYQIQEIGEE